MTMMDDETLRMYLEEASDHLADIESDLLQIEQMGAEIDEDLVNKVFRAAHSIKGGAGFMGLTTIKELSHVLENVLGLIRERELVPTSDVIGKLLNGFDMLAGMIDSPENSNDLDISAEVSELDNIKKESVSDDEAASVDKEVEIVVNGKTLFTVKEFDLNGARKSGKYIYAFEYDMIHDMAEEKTPLDVMRDMQDGGIVLASYIDVDAVGTIESELTPKLPFRVLFATVLDWDMISDVYSLPEEHITRIEPEHQATPAGAGAPASPAAEPAEPAKVEEVAGADAAAAKQAEPEIPEPKEAPKPRAAAEKAAPQGAPAKPSAPVDASLRVRVRLLDSLMTLAGELVLNRNQLMQSKSANDKQLLDQVCQRIDLITSELQETIMLTRMQPVGNIFNKFHRVVRDMAKSLSKEMDLLIEGGEVELDKTIIEGLSDPLTHLVRNSADHGIEAPDDRAGKGKPPKGTIKLNARHEAGQVIIEIEDDGKGLDPEMLTSKAMEKGLITRDQASVMSKKEKTGLIFLPGFSTAAKVSDVSGRGVGMDVVKTNLDKLGGTVEIDSNVGLGTKIQIKLPLTLAIIPSQVATSAGERFAIPQVNMDELLRIPAAQVKERIETVGTAEVVRLRGRLLPLVSLAEAVNLTKTYLDPDSGEEYIDRRVSISDRRSRKSPLMPHNPEGEGSFEPVGDNVEGMRSGLDRRYAASSAVNIVVVSTGSIKYGLVVDELNDAEEIVVKPLGRHLKNCTTYAGATIMGDGKVSLILDVAGIAAKMSLNTIDNSQRAVEVAQEKTGEKQEGLQSLLIFRSGEEEQFAVPVELVLRIERIKKTTVEIAAGRKVIQYRGGNLPLYTIDEVARVKPLADVEDLVVMVFSINDQEVGLLATGPLDAVDTTVTIDNKTLRQPGISGSAIIDEITTLFVDIYGIVNAHTEDWIEGLEAPTGDSGSTPRVLLVEDSDFFRSQLTAIISEVGYQIVEATDGVEAWAQLNENPGGFDILVTDIEMPNMDGFELSRRVRADSRFADMPIIAVTTRAADEDIALGKEIGITDYEIKLDKEKLLKSLLKNVGR